MVVQAKLLGCGENRLHSYANTNQWQWKVSVASRKCKSWSCQKFKPVSTGHYSVLCGSGDMNLAIQKMTCLSSWYKNIIIMDLQWVLWYQHLHSYVPTWLCTYVHVLPIAPYRLLVMQWCMSLGMNWHKSLCYKIIYYDYFIRV